MRDKMLLSGRMAAPTRSAFVVLLGLLLALAVCATRAAAGDPVPIEGKLLVTCWDQDWSFCHYYMTGSSDYRIPMTFNCGDAVLSPLSDGVAYWDGGAGICTANLDGSDDVNLTALAGLGGVNCVPRWSPDGSKISFIHADPAGGQLPCEAGFYPWIINSDGTGAYQLRPEETGGGIGVHWSPNGYRVLCYLEGSGYATLDIDGTDVQYVPNVGGVGGWSPDGSKILCNWTQWDEVAGQIGVWRQVGTTNADGSDPQVLVEQFVPEADVLTHYGLWEAELDPAWPDWPGNIRWWVGPVYPVWSPTGERIAFLAGMPFDPLGPLFWFQHEVWVYDLGTTDLTKITEDLCDDRWLSWNGDNTFPADPEVTVDNTTVTFSEVTGDGLTTILRDDDPPELPAGYQFCGEYYEISTTAAYSGPITICMTYEDGEVPGGNEDALALLHLVGIDPETGDGIYEDITTFKDAGANIVCGEVESLSVFGLAVMPIFGGFRPPINADGSSEWKVGRTIPVKFMVTDPFGAPIVNATCHLSCSPTLDTMGEGVMETAEAPVADVGDTFRYDEEEGQYIYNLSTKGMEPGAYLLEVTAEAWPGFKATVLIGLR